MSLLKKCISIMATGALAASLFAGMTFTSFADTVVSWEDMMVTTWYTPSSTATTYTISSAAELAGLAGIVNGSTVLNNPNYLDSNGNQIIAKDEFYGDTIILSSDIYLNTSTTTYEWIPIGGGASSSSFKGTFDGQNKTIYNIYYNETSGDYSNGNTVRNNIGLFGKVEEHALVKNVKMSGGSVAAQRSVGAIAGKSWGEIENCHNLGVYVYSTDSKGVGGIVGANWVNTTTNPPEVRNCTNAGTVVSTYYNTQTNKGGSAGGIAGENEGQIYNCVNTGSITSPYNAGGIVGSNKNDYNKQTQTGGTIYGGVSNSYNVGSVTGVYAGGIVGYELGSMRNVYSIGTISGTNAGQLIGELASSSARTHENLFYLSGTTAVGYQGSGIPSITTITFTSTTSGKDGLLTALNNWVTNAGTTIYSSWTRSSSVNNGYPVFV